jgi:hypothetical protein
VFRLDDGRYEVTGGYLQQDVTYRAQSRALSAGYAGLNCYYYNYDERGDADYRLRFDKGSEFSLKMIDGKTLLYSGRIDVSGTATRHWQENEKTSRGPAFVPKDCGKPMPGFGDDPFEVCPASSVYATTVMPDGSGITAGQLKKAHVGATFRLKGAVAENATKNILLFLGDEKRSGFDHAHMKWDLRIKKISEL